MRKLPPIELVEDTLDYAQRIKKCSEKCSYFVAQFMAFVVHEYNKSFLDCMDQFIVYRTGRQVGKSTSAALKAIHFGYFAPIHAKNLSTGKATILIASLSQDQAYLILEKISAFIQMSPTLKKAKVSETKSKIVLEWFDGSGITEFIVRPIGDTGASLRGFTTHFAILDEAAYVPEVVFEAFLPTAMTTGAPILITSTPKLKVGLFYKATLRSHTIYEKGISRPKLDENDKPRDPEEYIWTEFHVTSYDNPDSASNPKLMKFIQSVSAASKQQEVYGEFLDGGNSIISHNLLQESLRQFPMKDDKIQRPLFEYYDLGVDTSGKGQDETILTTYGVTPDGLVCAVDVYTETTTSQPALAREINKLDRIYGYRRIYMDETGIGDTLRDCCNELNNNLPIYGIIFTGEKTPLYVNLARLFEEKNINLSLLSDFHREKLIDQLSYMYWDYGKTKDQKPKVRTEHPDDYSDSSALAVFGQQKIDFIQEIEGLWDENNAGKYTGPSVAW